YTVTRDVTYTLDGTIIVDPGDPKNPTDSIDPSNPDGPKYPSGVDENDLNKTVSRTITYTGADKNPASVTQTGKYQRTATVDTKTGELLGYGAWTLVTNTDADQTNDGFTAITSPKILGYTADKDVSAVVLSNDEVSNFVKNSDDQAVTYTSDGSIEVTEPTDPTQPVDPSNPDGPKMPTITETDLTQKVSRTITYKINASNDPNKPAAPTIVTQTTEYKRSALVDVKTGELLGYTAWVIDGSNKLVAVTSPKLENYQANPVNVKAVNLTSSDVDAIRAGTYDSLDQTVVYTFVGKVTTTKDPDGGTTTITKNPDGEVTDVNKTWPDGDKTHVHVDVDTGNETVTETPNGKNPLPTVTVKPGGTVSVGNTTAHNTEPDGVVTLTHTPENSNESFVTVVNKDGSLTYSKNVGTDVVKPEVSEQKTSQTRFNVSSKLSTVKPSQQKLSATKKANKQKLPQTDEQTNQTGAVIGLSLLGMILSWVGLKRRKHDEN
ncbi:mucin-binding protein, partial [Pediococcus ethanolidurans]